MSISRNYWIAGAIALAVTLWMLSGILVNDARTGSPKSQSIDERAFRVEVKELRAEEVQQRIVAQGQVKPYRAATLRAQTASRVDEILVESGQQVQKGELLVRFAMEDRQARLEEARAELQQRQREYEAAKRLGEKGLQSQVKQDEAATALASARASLKRIELDIEHTRITAPFEGIVDEVAPEVGDFASVQSEVVTVVDNTPLIAEAYLSQRHFDNVSIGGLAQVTTVDGETHEGRIKSVAPRADKASRTFRVEIQIPNPDGIPANTSAEVTIPTGKVTAHLLSPAVLELDDDGTLGVKVVNDDNHVVFLPVEIVRSDVGGIWVTGLPPRARIITAGAGFVSPGQLVEVASINAD